MTQKSRIIALVAVLAVVALALLLWGWLQKRPAISSAEPEPGRIHVYLDGRFAANVNPEELAELPIASFVDKEKGKAQEGPRLKDVVLLYVQEEKLRSDSTITLTGVLPSGGASKSASLTWGQIEDPANHVLFDYSSSGDSIKLVSTLAGLDTRDQWVQGIERISITTRP